MFSGTTHSFCHEFQDGDRLENKDYYHGVTNF